MGARTLSGQQLLCYYGMGQQLVPIMGWQHTHLVGAAVNSYYYGMGTRTLSGQQLLYYYGMGQQLIVNRYYGMAAHAPCRGSS